MQSPASWSLAAVLAALTLAPAAAAAPIENEAALWAKPETRYVIVGETHGTAETPAFFGDLACDAHKSGRPVVVALEVDQRSQGAVDAFIASDGGPAARARFLEDRQWTGTFKDGRSSRAYLALFEQLRGCLQARKIVAVVAMKPYGPSSWTFDDYEAAMAALIGHAGTLGHHALVLVLVGNAHAQRIPNAFEGRAITSAAMNLPWSETIALRVTTEGDTWDCTGPLDSDCGVHPLGGLPAERRAISLRSDGFPGFDGTIDLGVPTTASPPAVPDQPSKAAG